MRLSSITGNIVNKSTAERFSGLLIIRVPSGVFVHSNMPASGSQTTSSLPGRFGSGMAHGGKRRPYCSVNLWAIVMVVLPMAICRDRISMAAASPLWRPPLYGAASRLRGGALNDGGDGTRGSENTRSHQRETLYEAYNMLHKLAQV